MARFHGLVGYGVTGEFVNGIWTTKGAMTERPYYGDILSDTLSKGDDKVNPDLRLTQRISIVADPYALGNYSNIKYVIDEAGTYWEVTSVETRRPRLILSTGGVYSGPKPESSESTPDGP